MKARKIGRVLLTGGAGFIGSHTARLLSAKGYQVELLDNLDPQVHGKSKTKPDWGRNGVHFIRGDIRDRKFLSTQVKGADAVIHLAAAVGVGQSMYQIERHVDVNTLGTAVLLDVLVNHANNVHKLIIASSMSIYGEGKYHCEKCRLHRYPEFRSTEQLGHKSWEPICSECGSELEPVPTNEEKPLMPTSIYAMSKRHQEEMSLLIGRTYGIRTVALRYFNTYGPGQALSNPYTGVASIFLSRILNGNPPVIFENGLQTRDFTNVKDVAEANVRALEATDADYMSLNIGTGQPSSILNLAEELINLCGSKVRPRITHAFRKGDVRHCYADTRKAETLLDFRTKVSLREGLQELVKWAIEHRHTASDLFDHALQQLRRRRLA